MEVFNPLLGWIRGFIHFLRVLIIYIYIYIYEGHSINKMNFTKSLDIKKYFL